MLGISEYDQKPLHGVKFDRANALKIATKFGLQTTAATTLGDAELNGDEFSTACAPLLARSWRGSRQYLLLRTRRPQAKRLNLRIWLSLPVMAPSVPEEAFLDIVALNIADKAAELTIILDACHSGGIATAATRSGGKAVHSAKLVSKDYGGKGGESCAKQAISAAPSKSPIVRSTARNSRTQFSSPLRPWMSKPQIDPKPWWSSNAKPANLLGCRYCSGAAAALTVDDFNHVFATRQVLN